jgi:hypothetical protein
MFRKLLLLLIFCSSFLCNLEAQEWKQRKFVFANGGRTIISANGQLRGTIGQALIGNYWGSSQSSSKLGSGFWYDGATQIGRTNSQIPPVNIFETFYGNDISQIHIFPNPTNSIISVKFKLAQTTEVEFTISDIFGNVVFKTENREFDTGEQYFNFDCSILVNGLYFIKVYFDEKSVFGKFSIIK